MSAPSNGDISSVFASLQQGNTTDDVFGLFIQFLLASITGIVAIIAFTVLRPRNKKVYQPNFYILDKAPPTLSYSIKWIYELFILDDQTILNSSGLDGLLTIATLKMFLHIFLILTPIIMIILIPIHLQGNNALPGSLSSISIMAIIGNPEFLYAHTAIMYFITIVVSYFTINMWHYYIQIYHQHVPANQSKTIFYTGINNKHKAHPIEHFVYDKYKVQCTGILLNDPTPLIVLFDKYNDLLNKLDKVTLPDPALALIKDLKELKYLIKQQQLKGMTSINYLPSGFAIFNNSTSAYNCSKKGLLRNAQYTPYHAVNVNDVVWSNVNKSPPIIKSRRFLARCLSLLLICCWVVPIIFLAPLTNLYVLQSYIPSVTTLLVNYPKLSAFIQSVFTPLLLKLLLLFMPDLFYFISNFQLEPTNTEIQKACFRKLFAFFIIGYYVLFTFSISIWFLINQIQTVHDYTSLKTVFNAWTLHVANAVTMQGIFWVNWLTLNGPGSIPIDLARFLPFLLIKFKSSRWYNHGHTPSNRELKQILNPPSFRHDVVLVSNLFMFFLAITYATIHPIILIFGLMFYFISYLVYKYQVIYVFNNSHNSGSYWPMIFNRIYIALLSSQAILLLLFRVYYAYYCSWMMFGLIVLTVISWTMQSRILKVQLKTGGKRVDEHMDETTESFQILHPLYFEEPENAVLDAKMAPLLMPYIQEMDNSSSDIHKSQDSFMRSTTTSLREEFKKQNGHTREQRPVQQQMSQESMQSMQSVQQPSQISQVQQREWHTRDTNSGQSSVRGGLAVYNTRTRKY